MYKKDYFHIADVQNQLYEVGLLRNGEKVVLTADNCVLLEYYTGKTFSYRMVNLTTLKAKRLYARQKPFTDSDYQKAMEKMLELAEKPDTDIKPLTPIQRAESLLTHIFTEILPKYDMYVRTSQLSLAIEMLQALWENKLALCEAEVGTGKTHAYILAVTVYNLFNDEKKSAIISTSTIALQKAIVEEYIPQISDILMKHRIINNPISFIIRKGKNHYACDNRVKCYYMSLAHNSQNENKNLLELLQDLFTGACSIDLDNLPLTNYVKERICVDRCELNCSLSSVCRYRDYIRQANTRWYDFQITNHNFVIADILNQKKGGKKLLASSSIIVFDEAHKLLDTAQQMYGMEFDNMEIERLTTSIIHTISNTSDKVIIFKLCEKLIEQNNLLFDAVRDISLMCYDKQYTFSIDTKCLLILEALTKHLQKLSVLFYTINPYKKVQYNRLTKRIDQIYAKMILLTNHSQFICWLELKGRVYNICTIPKQLDFLLYKDIWSTKKSYILTSGTLSVDGDFSHYKHSNGIDLLEPKRVFETRKESPFNYKSNALLYIPNDAPMPESNSNNYVHTIVEHIINLVKTTYGHTMILFTSYRLMEQVYIILNRYITDYPLFIMGKGKLETIKEFRKSGNGVLCASDSAGEGIDLSGDILSSLIIVRLPFPTPTPILEYKKSLYHFNNYLNEIIIPEMLIKLRQWIGRGIRSEIDTCVFTLLDGRANRRYRNDILTALPTMQVTSQLTDVHEFILKNKTENYFINGNKDE